jgi:hypothetical protein
MTNLTAAEAQILKTIGECNRFSYFDEGVSVGSHTWSDEFSYEVASLLSISAMAAGGVISSLIQKDIFKALKSSDGIALELTQTGIEAIERVGA